MNSRLEGLFVKVHLFQSGEISQRLQLFRTKPWSLPFFSSSRGVPPKLGGPGSFEPFEPWITCSWLSALIPTMRNKSSVGRLGKHSPIMKSKLTISLNQCVLLVMTCGAGTWRLIKKLERKLRSVLQAVKRIMLGVTLGDRKQAAWIREQTRVEDIIVQTEKKTWTLAGHVVRRNDKRWTTRVTE